MKETVSIGPIVLTAHQLNECLEKNQRYIVTASTVFEIRHVNYKPEFIPFYGIIVFRNMKPLTKKGSWMACTAKEVNALLGIELFT